MVLTWKRSLTHHSSRLPETCWEVDLTDMKILSDRKIFCRSEKKFTVACIMFSLAFLEWFTLVLAIGHLISPLVFIEVKVIQFSVFKIVYMLSFVVCLEFCCFDDLVLQVNGCIKDVVPLANIYTNNQLCRARLHKWVWLKPEMYKSTGARCVRKNPQKNYIILQRGELTCSHFFKSSC